MRNAQMEIAECLIYKIFHIPHSDFRIPVNPTVHSRYSVRLRPFSFAL
jgi:hypothetical protein